MRYMICTQLTLPLTQTPAPDIEMCKYLIPSSSLFELNRNPSQVETIPPGKIIFDNSEPRTKKGLVTGRLRNHRGPFNGETIGVHAGGLILK